MKIIGCVTITNWIKNLCYIFSGKKPTIIYQYTLFQPHQTKQLRTFKLIKRAATKTDENLQVVYSIEVHGKAIKINHQSYFKNLHFLHWLYDACKIVH